MMSLTKPMNPEELSRIGQEKLRLQIEPQLTDSDDGKFVAIDINSTVFEVDDDDLTAISRLVSRQPDAEVWLGRVGQSTTCRIGKSA